MNESVYSIRFIWGGIAIEIPAETGERIFAEVVFGDATSMMEVNWYDTRNMIIDARHHIRPREKHSDLRQSAAVMALLKGKNIDLRAEDADGREYGIEFKPGSMSIVASGSREEVAKLDMTKGMIDLWVYKKGGSGKTRNILEWEEVVLILSGDGIFVAAGPQQDAAPLMSVAI